MARYMLVDEDVTNGTAGFLDKVEAAIGQGYRPIGGPFIFEGIKSAGHRYRRMVQALYCDIDPAMVADISALEVDPNGTFTLSPESIDNKTQQTVVNATAENNLNTVVKTVTPPAPKGGKKK